MENVVDAIKQPRAGDVAAHQEHRQNGLDHIGERDASTGRRRNSAELFEGEASQSDRRYNSIAAPPHRRDGQPARRPRHQDIARRHGNDTPQPRKWEVRSR